MNEVLKEVAKNHDKWVSIVKSMGANGTSEDIVQEAYIRIYKYAKPEKIAPNGKVNNAFMFVILRNTFATHRKDIAKMKKVSLCNVQEIQQDDNIPWKQAQHRFDQMILKAQEDWHWYDKMLFNYYKDSGKSLREIEKETGISLTSLWNTVKNCKQRLKDSLGETYQDLINEDYELL